jgi:hypothetical protein
MAALMERDHEAIGVKATRTRRFTDHGLARPDDIDSTNRWTFIFLSISWYLTIKVSTFIPQTSEDVVKHGLKHRLSKAEVLMRIDGSCCEPEREEQRTSGS